MWITVPCLPLQILVSWYIPPDVSRILWVLQPITPVSRAGPWTPCKRLGRFTVWQDSTPILIKTTSTRLYDWKDFPFPDTRGQGRRRQGPTGRGSYDGEPGGDTNKKKCRTGTRDLTHFNFPNIVPWVYLVRNREGRRGRMTQEKCGFEKGVHRMQNSRKRVRG